MEGICCGVIPEETGLECLTMPAQDDLDSVTCGRTRTLRTVNLVQMDLPTLPATKIPGARPCWT